MISVLYKKFVKLYNIYSALISGSLLIKNGNYKYFSNNLLPNKFTTRLIYERINSFRYNKNSNFLIYIKLI